MNRQWVLFLIAIMLAVAVQAQSVNAVGLRQGAKLIHIPPSYAAISERNQLAKHSAGALFDDTPGVWCSKNTQFPFVFVNELTEEFEIYELRFNNNCENYPGIETKDVKVEFSTTGPNEGYQLVGKYSLEKGTIHEIPIATKKARWVRLTILSNYGHDKWVELAEFEAVGKQHQKLLSSVQIAGKWHTNWQEINFTQSGNTFKGNYAYDNVKGKVTNGYINRNMLFFKWQEGALNGTATLYLNAEGNRLSGLWLNSDNATDFGLWTMTRTIPKPIIYEAENTPLQQDTASDTGKTEVLNFNGSEVKVGEKVVLDNVLFVKSKSVLLPASLPQLNSLITLLKANNDIHIQLAGHTDNTGNDQKNVKLSEQRVASVTKYLIDHGIAANRISGKGFGPFQPLNNNANAEEKRLNRRVEFTLTYN